MSFHTAADPSDASPLNNNEELLSVAPTLEAKLKPSSACDFADTFAA
jgi:hypothetical protein